MKHTKRLILVPEEEYLALLAMLKPQDELSLERATVKNEMAKTLRKPRGNADIKMKKYDTLLKKKRNLEDVIERNPPKVEVIDRSKNPPSVPPYLDIGTPATPSIETTEKFEKTETPINFQTPVTSKSIIKPPSKRIKSTEKRIIKESGGIVPVSALPALKDYVYKNREKFGVGEDKRLRTITNRLIPNTNYEYILSAFAAPPSPGFSRPPGYGQLYAKLKKDKFFKSIAAQHSRAQKGSGKIKPIKAIKIGKQKPVFKPVIWAKL